MPIPILMPALSPTMETGTLAKWFVKEGDNVSSGDVIAEIETDKASIEFEAVDEGRIGKLLVAEGTTEVSVNTPIAVLLEEDEEDKALAGDFAPTQKTTPQTSATPDLDAPSPTQNKPLNPSAAVNAKASTKPNGQHRLFASPLARRLAKQNHIELEQVRGSGPQGRIIKHDIEQAIKSGLSGKAPPLSPSAEVAHAVQNAGTQLSPAVTNTLSDDQILALYDPGSFKMVPHDNMRRTIAMRLVEAKRTIPHFYLNIDCEIDPLLTARKRLNDRAPKDGPGQYKLSVNDFIIKALAMALQQVPNANATWTEQGILLHKSSDIGVAVAVEGGLFVPVLRHSELKSLSEISNEMKDLAVRARARRLAPHEYQGGTTSISNLGMFGIKKFDAVINPPHATILAVGQGERRVLAKGDDIVSATVMSVTLSCDHRVVDGALGAELLSAFKGFIEDPVAMLV